MLKTGKIAQFLASVLLASSFGTAAFACGGPGKYEMHLKKIESKSGECVPLNLEYPEIVGGFKQVEARLNYSDGKDHFLTVDLEVSDLDKKDGILSTYLCLTEDMLPHTSIYVKWFHYVEHEDGTVEMTFCHVDVDTGDLFSLLQSGGTKEIDPNHYIP